MARAFNGSNSRIYKSTTLLVYPFTASIWVNSGAATGNMVSLSSNNGNHRHTIGKTAASTVAVSSTVRNVATYSATRSCPSSSGVWWHVAGVWRSGSSRSVYVNGARTNNSSSISVTTNPGVINLGVNRADESYFNWFNGLLSSFGLWSVELTDDEILSLAQGFTPDKIRPQSLTGYISLNPDFDDRITGSSWTNANSTESSDAPPLR